MSGVSLGDLPSYDMLDVLHYMYEEDMTPTWEHESEFKDSIRSTIYRELYDTQYSLANNDVMHANADLSDYGGEPTGTVKPYISPTNPEDYQKLLEPPMR